MKTSFFAFCLAGLLAISTAFAQDDAAPTSSTSSGGGFNSSTRGSAGGGRGTQVTSFGGGRRGGAANAKPLDENVTIHIKGSISKTVPVDVTFTGCGPTFSLNNVISEVEAAGVNHPVIGTSDITITPVAGAADTFRVEYTVGCRIPVVNSSTSTIRQPDGGAVESTSATGSAGTSAGSIRGFGGSVGGGTVTSTVTYTNVSTSSTLILKMGQTISAANSDDQSLTISLSKPAP